MGAAASIASTGISAAGNIIAGNKAAKAQKQAAALSSKRYNEAQENYQPYLDAGSGALDMYKASLGLNGIDAQKAFYEGFQNDPGFQAATDYGVRGLENANAIGGRYGGSGNIRAGVGQYLQKNMLDAYKTRQSQLGGLADMGFNATSGLGSLGQGQAAQGGQFLANAGYYQGAGLANAGNAINQSVQNYQQNQAFQNGLSGAATPGGSNFFGNLFG